MSEIANIENFKNTPHADIFNSKNPRAIRLKLEEGEKISPHTHKDKNIIIYIIEGKIELTLDKNIQEMKERDIIRFDGEIEVSPKALKDSTALIILVSKTK